MALGEGSVWLALAVFVIVAGWRVTFGSPEERGETLDTLERLEGSWHVLAVMVGVPLFYRALLTVLQRLDRSWFPWGSKTEGGEEVKHATVRGAGSAPSDREA